MRLGKRVATIIIVGFIVLSGITPILVAERLTTKENVSATNYLHTKNLQLNSYGSNNESYIGCREYWAVIVGIGDYPGIHSDLPYSINEIISFENTLLNGGNWEKSHIYLVKDDAATKEGIFDAITWLGVNADRNDVSIFYYAGHGSRNYSTEYLSVYDGSISDDELDEKLDDVQGKIVVILDSCYSGGFIDEVGKRGRVVLTACREDEETYQYFNLSSGIFGYFVNFSLEWLTKSAETTFLFTWIFSVYYSNQLSKEFNGDYTIHPCMYDGTLGRVKLINYHPSVKNLLHGMLNISIKGDSSSIWKM